MIIRRQLLRLVIRCLGRRTNCWLWAREMAKRRASLGKEGYFVRRQSRWGKFPHFLYAERRASNGTLRVVSYVPVSPRPRRVPPPIFVGQVRWGDNP